MLFTQALIQAAKVHLPIDLVCCSGGLKNILYAFGVGYGLSMMSNAVLIVKDPRVLLKDKSASAHVALAGGALYFLYGARLAAFLLRRQASTSYTPKLEEVGDKSQKMPLMARSAITLFVALSQALYSIPLQLACNNVSAEAVVPAWSWGALAFAAGGLAIETVADEQKLAAKQISPNAPVMTGLYSLVRHPNYTGEIMFHIGMAGLLGTESASTAALALLSPAFMVWVMFGAAKRLDKEGGKKYSDNAGYKEWVQRTGSIVPGL